MLGGCLQPLLERATVPLEAPLRILDPACGDGAFLLEAYEVLQAWFLSRLVESGEDGSGDLERTPQRWRLTPRRRLQIVRDHLYGVDVDAVAIKRLRDRLRQRIAPDLRLASLTGETLSANFRAGNALTGRGLLPADSDRQERSRTALNIDPSDAPLAWNTAFSEVARDGGFNVVIGNPPYCREKNAKRQFDLIARTPLGRKWRQPRMDLWHYFLHRGLDLLCPDGWLSFIVNSYWTASTGARKLIERLRSETTFDEIVLLGDCRIFADVVGRHMIFRLRKGASDRPTRIVDLQGSSADAAEVLAGITAENWPNGVRGDERVGGDIDKTVAGVNFDGTDVDSYEVPRSSLFEQSRLTLGRPDPWLRRFRGADELGEMFAVRQGIAENPPFISARLQRAFEGCTAGEGVFVLTADELESLALTPAELSYLRPYFRASAIGRYRLPAEATHQILYLTHKTAPTLCDCPNLRGHLGRFRPILERRRETRNGSIAWWQLHWPRVESLFTEPRILSVQMGRRPQFVYAVRPTFVGFSVNLVQSESPHTLLLPALTGILNSTVAARWFDRYAKKRGTNLEINVGLLKRFPLPRIRDEEIEQRISRLVLQRQQLEYQKTGRPASLPDDRSALDDRTAHVDAVEAEIDKFVARLYRV